MEPTAAPAPVPPASTLNLPPSPPKYPNSNSTSKVSRPLMLNALTSEIMEPATFPPAPPIKVLHPMMLNAKGATLANIVNVGYLKGFFSLGENYAKEGKWKLHCTFCQKDIATGEGRPQNALLHLARQHVDLVNASVMKEIIKCLLTKEKEEENLIPTSALRLGSTPKRSSSDMCSNVDPQSLRRVMAEWIIADGLPFFAIEGRGFHNLMNFLRPDVDYPGRLTVMKELPLLASELLFKLQEQIKSMLAVSFTLDFWSAKDKLQSGFMSVNLTGITSIMEFQEATIAMELIPGKHTGLVTAKALSRVLVRFCVIAKNIGGITTDDGSAMTPGN